MTVLLAKSSRGPTPRPEETIRGHCQAVTDAADTILTALSDRLSSQFGFADEPHIRRLESIVMVAAAFHDLGKANDQFQAMVRGQRSVAQAVRHEVISWWLLQQRDVAAWLAPVLEGEPLLVSWVVAGHHLRFPPGAEIPPGSGDRITFHGADDQIRSVLERLAARLGLDSPPMLQDRTVMIRSDLLEQVEYGMVRARGAAARQSRLDRDLLAVAKALLISADVVGSAVPRRHLDIAGWVRSALRDAPQPAAVYRDIAHARLGKARPRPFQDCVANSGSRVTLVRAGCGSGKTVAAYLWAARHADARRLFFAYPTTGTATEGFRDYLTDPSLDARLVHSRAAVDLEMLSNTRDDAAFEDVVARIDALDLWHAPVVSCTADTVLGLMQSHRRALFAFPVFAQSAFVFDEIHAYDARMWHTLLDFLITFRGAPILLMTASLPAHREEQLRDVLLQNGETLGTIPGPDDLEQFPRYVRGGADPADAWAMAADTLAAGGKVLWVCNVVERARQLATEATQRGIANVLVYHSRFRYVDRVRRHADLIEAFGESGPAIAFCTQVAEMSLDLSADLLVTDAAPVPALIQRLGRLNRRATPADPRPPAPFIVLPVSRPLPYAPDELAAAQAWLESLPQQALSQSDLATAWAAMVPADVRDTNTESAWIAGGFRSEQREVREGTPGVTILLPRDAADVDAGKADPVRVELPMPQPPRSFDWRQWRRVAYRLVPPDDAVQYDPMKGARWSPQQ